VRICGGVIWVAAEGGGGGSVHDVDCSADESAGSIFLGSIFGKISGGVAVYIGEYDLWVVSKKNTPSSG